jgi:hypothetical protein
MYSSRRASELTMESLRLMGDSSIDCMRGTDDTVAGTDKFTS